MNLLPTVFIDARSHNRCVENYRDTPGVVGFVVVVVSINFMFGQDVAVQIFLMYLAKEITCQEWNQFILNSIYQQHLYILCIK